MEFLKCWIAFWVQSRYCITRQVCHNSAQLEVISTARMTRPFLRPCKEAIIENNIHQFCQNCHIPVHILPLRVIDSNSKDVFLFKVIIWPSSQTQLWQCKLRLTWVKSSRLCGVRCNKYRWLMRPTPHRIYWCVMKLHSFCLSFFGIATSCLGLKCPETKEITWLQPIVSGDQLQNASDVVGFKFSNVGISWCIFYTVNMLHHLQWKCLKSIHTAWV